MNFKDEKFGVGGKLCEVDVQNIYVQFFNFFKS